MFISSGSLAGSKKCFFLCVLEIKKHPNKRCAGDDTYSNGNLAMFHTVTGTYRRFRSCSTLHSMANLMLLMGIQILSINYGTFYTCCILVEYSVFSLEAGAVYYCVVDVVLFTIFYVCLVSSHSSIFILSFVLLRAHSSLWTVSSCTFAYLCCKLVCM